ncbi:MAG: efflux RND transporter periplasmic adaptor subunit [Anaerolineae bacterium]|nr:efflux RND transporter periplasmic adaptor subunit [Anaerolineae bacterium]
MKKSLHLLGVSLAASMVLSACSAVGLGNRNNNDTLNNAEKVTVSRGSIENRVIATGKVTAKSTASVAFPRAGVLTKLLVAEGETVKAGQPLAQQDISDLKLTELQQYANFISAQAAYSATVKGPSAADLASAQASLKSAESAYNDLLKKPSANETGSLLANVNNAKANLDQKRSNANGQSQEINNLRATLANAETTLRQRQQEAAGNSQDINNLKATLMNAEAALKVKQAAYDRAYKANPAGIGGHPSGLELEQATNSYNIAKANYDKGFETTRTNLERAQNDYAAAKANFDKANENSKIDLTRAQNDYMAAVSNYNVKFDSPKSGTLASAQAQIDAARAKLAGLTPTDETIAQQKAKVDQTYAAWRLAADNVEKATILAPFDGLVTTLKLSAGDWANMGVAVVQIAEFTEPVFEVDVEEADLGAVRVGQEVRVRLQTYPDVNFNGKVRSVATVGTNSGSVVNYKVKVGVSKPNDNSNTPILLNMSGTSEIVTAKAENALLLPVRALSIDPTTKAFSVQRLKKSGETQSSEKVAVKVGFRTAEHVQITDGVGEGDVIIIPSQKVVTNGVPPGLGN